MSSIKAKVFLSICIVCILDGALFHSGLYTRVLLSPNSMMGAVYQFVKYETQRPSSKTRDIIVVGDSKVSEGFNAKTATDLSTGQGISFVQGGVPGSTLRTWYYLLRRIDPNRDRYKAVVIALSTYRKEKSREDFRNRMLDVDFLAPNISFSEMLDFAKSYPSRSDQISVVFKALLLSQNFRMDFQDFLLHPRRRIADLAWRKEAGGSAAYDYRGHAGNMTGLRYDPNTKEFHYPTWLNQKQKAAVEQHFKESDDTHGLEDEYEDYTDQWTRKICEFYKGSGTQLIFVRFPSRVLGENGRTELPPYARFFSTLSQTPGVRLIDENQFAELENPSYFWDTLHMNRAGQVKFSTKLAAWFAENLKQSGRSEFSSPMKP